MFRKGLLIAAVLMVFAGPAAAQQSPVPAAEYWNLIESIENALVEDETAAGDKLAPLIEDLDSIHSVQMTDGSVLPVDHAYLITLLKDDPIPFDRIRSILASAQNLRNTVPRQTFTEQDLARVAEILSGSEFQWDETPNPLLELWSRLQEAFLRFVSRFIPNLRLSESVLSSGLGVLLGFVLLLIFAFIYRSTVKNITREAEMKPSASGPRRWTPDEALEQARRLSSAGNRRDAVRYLFLAALLSLEKRGLIRTDRSRTNQEVLDSLSDYPNIQAQLHGLILVFDRVWYGHHPLDDEAFSAFEFIVNRLNTREEQA